MVTSSQVVVKLRSEPIGVDDPGRLVGGHGHQFEHPSVSVRADHEEAVFALVVVLDQPHGIDPSVLDVRVVDPVASSRRPDLHPSSMS